MRHAALRSSAGRQEGLVQVPVPLHGAVSKIQIFCSVLSVQLGARGALLLCVLWGWAGSTWQSQVSCAGCWWIWLNTAEFLQKLRFTGVMDPVRAGSLELSSDFWICWEMQAGLGMEEAAQRELCCVWLQTAGPKCFGLSTSVPLR